MMDVFTRPRAQVHTPILFSFATEGGAVFSVNYQCLHFVHFTKWGRLVGGVLKSGGGITEPSWTI